MFGYGGRLAVGRPCVLGVSFKPEDIKAGRAEYNYRVCDPGLEDLPGDNVFYRDESGAIYHTYSTYARGLDGLWGMYQWLDRAPRGRNEQGLWWRRHDEYDKR